MNYGQIRKYDISNGPGIRVTLFVTGCTHNCKGCFNKEYQNFNAGKKYTNIQTNEIITYLNNPVIEGFTLLGGEPMQNVEGLLEPLKKIRNFIDENNKKLKIKQTIWVYSGYTFEEIINSQEKLELLKLCDVLVDGKFIEELLNLKLRFRGSENQRIIDIQKSLKYKQPILLKDFN